MMFLYNAQYSIVLLRPKNQVEVLTQSASGQICMGKWPAPSLAEFIHHVLVIPCVPEFFFQCGWFPSSGEIKLKYKTTRGRGRQNS